MKPLYALLELSILILIIITIMGFCIPFISPVPFDFCVNKDYTWLVCISQAWCSTHQPWMRKHYFFWTFCWHYYFYLKFGLDPCSTNRRNRVMVTTSSLWFQFDSLFFICVLCKCMHRINIVLRVKTKIPWAKTQHQVDIMDYW